MQTHADELKRQIALASKYKPVLTEYLQALTEGKKVLYKLLAPEFSKRLSQDPRRFSEDDRVTVKIWGLWEGQHGGERTLVIKGVREHSDRVEIWLEEKLTLSQGKQPSLVKAVTLVWGRKQTWRRMPQGWRLSAVEESKTPKSVLFNAQLKISLPGTDRV